MNTKYKQSKRNKVVTARVAPGKKPADVIGRLGRKVRAATMEQLIKWLPRRIRELNKWTQDCHLWLADLPEGSPLTFRDYPHLQEMVLARTHLQLLDIEYRSRVTASSTEAILAERNAILSQNTVDAVKNFVEGDAQPTVD